MNITNAWGKGSLKDRNIKMVRAACFKHYFAVHTCTRTSICGFHLGLFLGLIKLLWASYIWVQVKENQILCFYYSGTSVWDHSWGHQRLVSIQQHCLGWNGLFCSVPLSFSKAPTTQWYWKWRLVFVEFLVKQHKVDVSLSKALWSPICNVTF